MQQLIRKPLFNETEAVTTRLGELNLTETHGIKDGEQIYELIFQSGKTKFPQGWE